MADEPITSLLSQVLIALTIELDNDLEHRMSHITTDHGRQGSWGPWLTSYAAYANFLRFVGDKGIVMQDLAAKAGYPPPVHPAYHGMRRWGYVTYTPDIAGSTPKKKDAEALVTLAPGGQLAARSWPEALVEVQARWTQRGLDSLAAALIPIGIAAFVGGGTVAKITDRPFLRGAIRQLLLAAAAAGATYGIGSAVSTAVG